jgi:hypothetical protein
MPDHKTVTFDASQWQLVPKVPTGEMLKAGNNKKNYGIASDVYTTMLDAAPTPAAQSAGQEAVPVGRVQVGDGSITFIPDADAWRMGDEYEVFTNAAPVNGGERTPIKPVTYTTKPAESVMGIALRQCGNEDAWRQILAWNPRFESLASCDYFPVGTVLVMPPREHAADAQQVGTDGSAERYAWIVGKAQFSTTPGQPPVMTLSLELPAPDHNPHTDWIGDRFVESFNRTIDFARGTEGEDDDE